MNIDCQQNGCYRYNISNSESLGDSGIGQFSDGVRISFITLSKPITIPDISWRDYASLLGLHADYRVPAVCLA